MCLFTPLVERQMILVDHQRSIRQICRSAYIKTAISVPFVGMTDVKQIRYHCPVASGIDVQLPRAGIRLTGILSDTFKVMACHQLWARPLAADRALVLPSRKASRPSGFDPARKDYGAPRRGHSGKGPAVMEHAGVAITAPFPGALLTGLVAALGPACRLRRRYAHAPAGAIFR
jgi:hypothetical protein